MQSVIEPAREKSFEDEQPRAKEVFDFISKKNQPLRYKISPSN